MKTKESQTADLQEILKLQQEETSKAKEELKGALSAMEKLKQGFKTERTNWETEKAALLKRTEDAEVALKPMEAELTGLKNQVNSMTAAVFGKYLRTPALYYYQLLWFNLNFLNHHRPSHCSSWNRYADEIEGGLHTD